MTNAEVLIAANKVLARHKDDPVALIPTALGHRLAALGYGWAGDHHSATHLALSTWHLAALICRAEQTLAFEVARVLENSL